MVKLALRLIGFEKRNKLGLCFFLKYIFQLNQKKTELWIEKIHPFSDVWLGQNGIAVGRSDFGSTCVFCVGPNPTNVKDKRVRKPSTCPM